MSYSYYYTKREHDEALKRHGELWAAMHAIGKAQGRESSEYLEARAAVVDAARCVRVAARKPVSARRRGMRAR